MKKKKVIFPYLQNCTKIINNVLRKHDAIPVNKILRKQRGLSSLDKDKLILKLLFYHISCGTCPKNFVGSSSRSLNKRKGEHMNALQKNNKSSAWTKTK